VNRIAGIETEYGCLVNSGVGHGESWPARVKNHIFKKLRAGVLDQHYRDYEEPPGNGGFLLNGGRFYLDMGHIEYATPECRSVRDLVACDLAGDAMLQGAIEAMGVSDNVAFLKNNIDHGTGATFGCHENYLMRRETEFTGANTAALLSFLATRQIFTGAGRVGQANPLAFEIEPLPPYERVDFQMSQRADHIVNDIYQWVQFNRAIINARDEPLADYRRYRRLHLLIGDSNMSPLATALKVGTTHLMLVLLEEDRLPRDVALNDAVLATRMVSRACRADAPVQCEDGHAGTAMGIQEKFLAAAQSLAGRDAETDWLLGRWAWVLDALRRGAIPELLGAVDWVSKKWLLDTFRAEQGIAWDDPWLESLDLEYHNLNPARGLFHAMPVQGEVALFNREAFQPAFLRTAPADTRAHARGLAVAHCMETHEPCVFNWDSLTVGDGQALALPDPLETYDVAVRKMLVRG
jgi:proteasome accessory factor A